MKKLFFTLYFVGIFGGLFNWIYQDYKRIKLIETLNTKIEYLKNEGYTSEAACLIAHTELGLIPVSKEYQSLKED